MPSANSKITGRVGAARRGRVRRRAVEMLRPHPLTSVAVRGIAQWDTTLWTYSSRPPMYSWTHRGQARRSASRRAVGAGGSVDRSPRWGTMAR